MTDAIVPVILCGGSGTRLWPLSRQSQPKQFGRVLGERSLFQAAVERLAGVPFAPPVVVTASDFRFVVLEQLAGIGRAPGAVVLEPSSRNTGPAILAAALAVEAQEPGALLLVCPSDHVVEDAGALREAVAAGTAAARGGALVTFGVAPVRPETGLGYLELAAGTLPLPGARPAPLPLRRFVEKPDAAAAAAMLAGGRHLWNSGIFLFSARAITCAFRCHQPALHEAVAAAVAGAEADLGFLRLAPGPWAEVPAISVDYAVMEKADSLVTVPLPCGWSDLGSWRAIAAEMEADATGNALSGPAFAIDCEASLLRAESGDQVLVGLGLRNVVAIAMRDAVLVADLSADQRVGEAVALLRAERREEAAHFPRCHRPWGWYETLSLGHRFQVKRIMVHPGGVLSLQSHFHRAEHWVVVEGTARVTVGNRVELLSENQSAYVPLGTPHRLENPGRVDLHLVEVQSGVYLGEDDIMRYQDAYARA